MNYQDTNITNNPETRELDTSSGDRNLVTRKIITGIWIFATVVEALLGFRFVLKLFAANPGNLFARLVYATTDFLVFPFHTLVNNPAIGNGVFEITTLIAILVYIFLAWLVIQLALLIFKK